MRYRNSGDNYRIDYSLIKFKDKDLFVFLNHKAALFCWAKIKEKNGIYDVITFDSHCDFSYGIITKGDLTKLGGADKKCCLVSKFVRPDLEHFSTNKEFLEWNLIDDEENKRIAEKEHKFLKWVSDNFIDVAFMKNVVKDVHHYYLNLEYSRGEDGKCDDFNDKNHYFTSNKLKEFKEPKEKFILDIDLDFFVNNEDCKMELIKKEEIKEKLEFLMELAESSKCVGITVALEPKFCGSLENCLELGNLFSQVFGIDINSITKGMLKDVEFV